MARPASKDEQIWVRFDRTHKRAAKELAMIQGRTLSNWVYWVCVKEIMASGILERGAPKKS